MPPRRRPFTILPTRERDEISVVRSRPAKVHTCDVCGVLTKHDGLCVECTDRGDDNKIETWK